MQPPEQSASHTIFIIDSSGYMLDKKNDIHLYPDSQNAAFRMSLLQNISYSECPVRVGAYWMGGTRYTIDSWNMATPKRTVSDVTRRGRMQLSAPTCQSA